MLEILRRYPNARFVHIYRNPFEVFLSTRHLYRSAVTPFIVQKYPELKMDRDFVQIYARMMKKFFAEEPKMPKDRLFSISFEGFHENPMGALEDLYKQLNIAGFERARPHFQRYLESQGEYRQNRYTMSDEDKSTVMRHWGFAVEHWGYSLPE